MVPLLLLSDPNTLASLSPFSLVKNRPRGPGLESPLRETKVLGLGAPLHDPRDFPTLPRLSPTHLFWIENLLLRSDITTVVLILRLSFPVQRGRRKSERREGPRRNLGRPFRVYTECLSILVFRNVFF